MKKLLMFFFALVAATAAWAQGKCDFSTFNEKEVYTQDYLTTTSNADGWTAEYVMTHAGWNADSGEEEGKGHFSVYGEKYNVVSALVLNGNTTKTGKLTSPTLTGGCGTLSLNFAAVLSISNNQKLSLHVSVLQNDVVVNQFDVVREGVKQYEKFDWSQEVNVEGDFSIEIVNNCPSGLSKNKDRTSVWNVEWTGYPAAAGGKPVANLGELSNDKTYAIQNVNGGGYLTYTEGDAHVTLAGAETWLGNQNGGINEKWTVPFEGNNPNHLWQVVNVNDTYYLYNVGARAYVQFVKKSAYNSYDFSKEPKAIKVTDNGNGTFGFNTTGEPSEYLCITNGFAEAPCRWWKYDDDGSVFSIVEAEYPADNNVVDELNVAKQFAEALAAAKAQYEANTVYELSDNLFTDPAQFYSDWTEPNEGSVEGCCDGDPETFWHSNWSNGSVAPRTHDFFITLPEAVGGDMQFDMTRRKQAANDHILAFDVYASATASNKAADYTFVGTVETPFTSNTETVAGHFTVPEGTASVRFVIAHTYVEPTVPSERGYAHFAEFKLYVSALVPECFNAQNPKAAAAFAEALAQFEALTAPSLQDLEDLQAALAAYEAGDPLVAAIRLDGTDLYFSTTEVADHAQTTYSLAAEPEYFTFTPTADGGYVLQSESTGKYVGHSVTNSWDFSNNASTWYIADLEGNSTQILKNATEGFGTDDAWDGAGVYTDKNGSKQCYYLWAVEAKTALPKPDSFVYDMVLPADKEVVEELSVIRLTFPDKVQVVTAATVFDGVTVVNAAGESVTITAFSVDDASPNVVNITLAEPITEFGKYSITVPAQYIWNSKANFDAEDMGLSRGAVYNPEFTLNYVVATNPLPEVGKYYFIRNENFGKSNMLRYIGAGETPSQTAVAWLCSLNENGKYVFTNETGETLHFRGWADGGDAWEITPMYLLTDKDMERGKLPEEYVKPDVVVMRASHRDGKDRYLNVNLNTGNYDHGATLYAPWNSSYTSFFVFEEVTEWSGDKEDIVYTPATEVTEAADLVENFQVEFKHASSVEPSAFGLIGGVYDETGDIYGIIFSGVGYDLFGQAYAGRSNIKLNFQPLNTLDTPAAANVIKRIGDFATPAAGEVSVYFCPKSFAVDGKVVNMTLSFKQELSGNGGTTGIDTVNASESEAEVFDLFGRRVAAPVKGNLYIQNGKKVLK